MLKHYSPKQLLLAAIAAVVALFNFFTPIFSVVGVSASLGIFGSLSWSVNGYQIPFGAAGDAYEALFSDSYGWYMFCGWLHLILSVALVALLVYVFIMRSADMEKASFLTLAVSGALSLLYLINGIVSLNTVGEGANTVAFVPFIIVAVLAAAYFACYKLLGDKIVK